MKEDITQRGGATPACCHSCGLVRKEDITQLMVNVVVRTLVVVW